MRLVYTSNPLSLVIEHYEPMYFEYNEWIVSDEYIYDEKNKNFSKYKIIVTSEDISQKEDLNAALSIGHSIIEKLSILVPFFAMRSLNEPKYIDGTRTQSIIAMSDPLKGWSSNYEEIERVLNEEDDRSLKITLTCLGYIHYARIPKSPLEDLRVMLENYEHLSDIYQFLIFLHNAILESEDANRYMLIGKALEIVNAIYPYERQRGRSDDRIERLHPELLTVFGATTIKDLIEWSNNRQESRHYVGRGTNPHPPLTMEEKEQLYTCSVYLITNIIRLQLGLEVITFKQDEVQI